MISWFVRILVIWVLLAIPIGIVVGKLIGGCDVRKSDGFTSLIATMQMAANLCATYAEMNSHLGFDEEVRMVRLQEKVMRMLHVVCMTDPRFAEALEGKLLDTMDRHFPDDLDRLFADGYKPACIWRKELTTDNG